MIFSSLQQPALLPNALFFHHTLHTSHLLPAIEPLALISTHAQMHNFLTISMAGKVMCDTETVALQRHDAVHSSPTWTLLTIIVILSRS